MMVAKFKIGDRVKRIKGEYQGMMIGDIVTVRNIEGNRIYLNEYLYEHDPINLELIERAETVLENYEIY